MQLTTILLGSVHLLFVNNGEILLLKRRNTGFEDGKWSVVAGKLDGNEEVKKLQFEKRRKRRDSR